MITSKFEFISDIYLYLGNSFLIGSEVVFPVVFFFLSIFLWDLPFRSLRNDSLKDFLRDFLRDIGLSSAFAISRNSQQCFLIFCLLDIFNIILQKSAYKYSDISYWPCAFKVHFEETIVSWRQSKITNPWAVPAAINFHSSQYPKNMEIRYVFLNQTPI